MSNVLLFYCLSLPFPTVQYETRQYDQNEDGKITVSTIIITRQFETGGCEEGIAPVIVGVDKAADDEDGGLVKTAEEGALVPRPRKMDIEAFFVCAAPSVATTATILMPGTSVLSTVPPNVRFLGQISTKMHFRHLRPL